MHASVLNSLSDDKNCMHDLAVGGLRSMSAENERVARRKIRSQPAVPWGVWSIGRSLADGLGVDPAPQQGEQGRECESGCCWSARLAREVDGSPTMNRADRRIGAIRDHVAAVPQCVIASPMAAGKQVRVGIVGVGGMGSGHYRNITSGDVPSAKIVALCDVDPEKLKVHEGKGYELFTDSDALIKSGLCDAVVIATPHYYHTTIAIAAIAAGLNVLTEKPLSVHKQDCEAVIAAFEARPDKSKLFAEMFNQRTDKTYIKMRSMVQGGALGELKRVNWIITNWFRTQAYYDGGGWRATWAGEGGGVLSNQCPHNLDLVQWICGMPSSVSAHIALGKHHDIEVEDDVTAFMEYPNGATGVFITTTGEAPGTNRLEVVGTKGKLVSEGGVLTFTENSIGSDAGETSFALACAALVPDSASHLLLSCVSQPSVAKALSNQRHTRTWRMRMQVRNHGGGNSDGRHHGTLTALSAHRRGSHRLCRGWAGWQPARQDHAELLHGNPGPRRADLPRYRDQRRRARYVQAGAVGISATKRSDATPHAPTETYPGRAATSRVGWHQLARGMTLCAAAAAVSAATANSMVLSGLRGGEKVSLPMDSADFAKELQRL
eukprot:47233_4